ncbi:hypothetical protein K439DRAFT_1631541 [Ramaria rubella]|nr:hypothetical protein K439DRAFT_1631541 [Ramaria rubella]
MEPPMLSSLPSSTGAVSSQPTSVSHSKVPSTSSLLFGFLITFLALFLMFVMCGLGSRYMVDRRRQRDTSESDPLYPGGRKSSKPTLWDVWAVPGHEKWEEMMPLSAEIRGLSTSASHEPSRHIERTPVEQLLYLYHGFGRYRGFVFSSPSSRSSVPVVSSQGSKPRMADEPVNLQISVLVSMPSRTRDSISAVDGKEHAGGKGPARDLLDIPEVAMGVATIPWDKERVEFG